MPGCPAHVDYAMFSSASCHPPHLFSLAPWGLGVSVPRVLLSLPHVFLGFVAVHSCYIGSRGFIVIPLSGKCGNQCNPLFLLKANGYQPLSTIGQCIYNIDGMHCSFSGGGTFFISFFLYVCLFIFLQHIFPILLCVFLLFLVHGPYLSLAPNPSPLPYKLPFLFIFPLLLCHQWTSIPQIHP